MAKGDVRRNALHEKPRAEVYALLRTKRRPKTAAKQVRAQGAVYKRHQKINCVVDYFHSASSDPLYAAGLPPVSSVPESMAFAKLPALANLQ